VPAQIPVAPRLLRGALEEADDGLVVALSRVEQIRDRGTLRRDDVVAEEDRERTLTDGWLRRTARHVPSPSASG
jgi:hypothetical protein